MRAAAATALEIKWLLDVACDVESLVNFWASDKKERVCERGTLGFYIRATVLILFEAVKCRKEGS